MYGLSFDKINVIIACCEEIYGRYCTKKVKMITSTHNLLSSSQYKKVVHFVSVFFSCFCFWFLVLENLPPLRNHVKSLLIPSVLKRVQRWRASWIRSIVLAAWKRPPQNICYTLYDYVSYCYCYRFLVIMKSTLLWRYPCTLRVVVSQGRRLRFEERPFAFPSNMRVHVMPTSNDVWDHFLLIRRKH